MKSTDKLLKNDTTSLLAPGEYKYYLTEPTSLICLSRKLIYHWQGSTDSLKTD